MRSPQSHDSFHNSFYPGGHAVFEIVRPRRGQPAPEVGAAALVAAFSLDATGRDVAVHVVAVAADPDVVGECAEAALALDSPVHDGLAAEVGAIFVSGLPEQRPGQRYGRNTVFGRGAANDSGYVTDFSWGYRLRTAATYRDVFLGIDLIPSIAWSHDVDGWSPEPGQAFNEGRQSVGLGLGFEFDANTRANITYTTFSDGADFDPLKDRDFISMTASYSF